MPIAQADTQIRPPISGFLVNSAQGGGKTVLHASQDAAGADFCISRGIDSSGPGGRFTGAYRWETVSAGPPVQWRFACQYQRFPQGNEPAPEPVWVSDPSWGLPFVYACKNAGATSRTPPTCYAPADRPPQRNACDGGKGENETPNPVDFSAGQKLRREADYQGANGLNFTRQYMSNPLFDGFAPHWRHNFDLRMFSSLFPPPDNVRSGSWVLDNTTNTWNRGVLSGGGTPGIANFNSFAFQPASAGVTEAYFTRDDGYALYFTSKDQGQTWATDSDVNYQLHGIAADAHFPKGRWQLDTPSNDKEIYDGGTGVLLEIRFRDGRVQTLRYNLNDGKPTTLAQVTDNFGRSLTFTWGGSDNVLLKMTDPDHQDFVYGYDNHSLLTSVTYPDGLSRLYHYDEPAYATWTGRSLVDGFLTGITDEVTPGTMVRWGTFQYNSKGQPVSSELAGGAEKYQVDYTTDTVTDPLGTARQYTFQFRNGIKLQSGISQPAGAGCAPAATQKSYDDNANLASVTDYNGAITVYGYYPGNLIKSKTEASGTDQQRTTTWEWHPVFRQPSKIAAPKLLTTFEYDANGNLTATSEQATLDATGAQGLTPVVTGTVRKTSALYNAVGQVLTETTLKDGIEQTTRYQYNGLDGNLESITAPGGKITRFSNYTAHGDVGRIEQAGGRITDFTYFPRRWLQSATQNSSNGDSLRTTWAYDSRGRTVRETRADGGIKIYNHDDAGRLINIAENIDNSIDFTLDPMGNHVLEQVRDPNGVLVSQTRRAYDALGRLQQTFSAKAAPVQDVSSSTTLSSSNSVAQPGFPLRLVASVSGNLPTGEVVFMEGATRLAVQFIHDGKATLDISNLPLGNHVLSAFYSGDNRNQASRSSEWLQVIQPGVANSITLTCPAFSTIEGTTTCNADLRTDAANLNRLNGQALKLREGSTVLGTGVLQVKDGAASTQFTLAGLTLGAHQFQAFYAGDAVLLASQSNVAAHTVQPHAPQITRLTLSGPLDVGALYEVSLPGTIFGSYGYATYTVTASDTSLADIARHLAANVQAVTRYQVQTDGATLTITGPDKEAFAVHTSVYNRPGLYEGEFFQQALAPRPGTSARLKMDLGFNDWGQNSTGDYQFNININRYAQNHVLLEHRNASFTSNKRPTDNNAVLDDLCNSFATSFPGMPCLRFSDTRTHTAFFDLPLGQDGWEINGTFYYSDASLMLDTSIVTAGETTILVPQPQIMSIRTVGKVFGGVVYSVTAGNETWRYTSSAQDTPATILNGLAAAVAQSSQYVPSVVAAGYGILNLQIASKTPVLPFTYSYATSNYPVDITGSLIQAAR